MKKLVCLIDPSWDYHKLLKTINENWNSIECNTEIWVGCTHDKGKKTKDILENLRIPIEKKFLFPGTLRQGIYAGGLVNTVFIPRVVGKNFSLKRKFINFLVFLGDISVMLIHRKTKRAPYLYLVLSRKTRVGKKVDAVEMTDEDAVSTINHNLKSGAKQIYIEGGSNAEHSVAERISLLKSIKQITQLPLYCGGGIKTSEEFEHVAEIADKVIVGHCLGEEPEKILEFSKIIEKLNKT